MNWRFVKVGRRLLPGAITAILLAGLTSLGGLTLFEQAAYQTLFQLRGERPWDDRLVLIKIDDASIKQIGRFPWSRRQYVPLLNQLAKADASVVAIDLIFSESSPDDAALAQAMARSQQVVLAQAEDASRSPLLPVPILQEQALGTGHIRVVAAGDGIVRTIEPQVRGALALGVAAVEAYSLKRETIPQVDVSQPIWLNWVAPARSLPQYSFAEVVQGKVSDRAFRNKIVLVGVTATGIDAALTPFDQNSSASGVHLQATLIHNLLQQNTLHPLDQPWVMVVVFVAGSFGLSAILSFFRSGIQVAITVGLSISWFMLGAGALQAGYLLPIALPISLLMTTAIVTILIDPLPLKYQHGQRSQERDIHEQSTRSRD